MKIRIKQKCTCDENPGIDLILGALLFPMVIAVFFFVGQARGVAHTLDMLSGGHKWGLDCKMITHP